MPVPESVLCSWYLSSNRTKCCQLSVIRCLLFSDVCPLFGEEKILWKFFLSFIFFLRCAKLYRIFFMIDVFCFWWKFIPFDCNMLVFIFGNPFSVRAERVHKNSYCGFACCRLFYKIYKITGWSTTNNQTCCWAIVMHSLCYGHFLLLYLFIVKYFMIHGVQY